MRCYLIGRPSPLAHSWCRLIQRVFLPTVHSHPSHASSTTDRLFNALSAGTLRRLARHLQVPLRQAARALPSLFSICMALPLRVERFSSPSRIAETAAAGSLCAAQAAPRSPPPLSLTVHSLFGRRISLWKYVVGARFYLTASPLTPRPGGRHPFRCRLPAWVTTITVPGFKSLVYRRTSKGWFSPGRVVLP